MALIGFKVLKKSSYANVSLNFVDVAIDLQLLFLQMNVFGAVPSGSCEKDFSGGSFRRTL